jgi:uncharacterized protein YggE
MERVRSPRRTITYFVIPAILLLAIMLLLAGCGGGSKDRISVVGAGTGKAVPDEARVTVSVVTEAPTVQQATAPNNQATQAVMAALKGLGLDEKSMKTDVIEIYPNYSEPDTETGTSEIVGYTATTRITVSTKKVDMAGQIIETALAAGANTVDTLDMRTTAQAAAQAAGLKEAVDNARKKAEIAAKAAGRKLGKIVSVREIAPGELPYGAEAGGAGDGETTVSPGQNEYPVQARVTFELD